MGYIKPVILTVFILLITGCTSDAVIFPVCHELQKLEIVDETLNHYLENEADLIDKFKVQSLNLFFIEQNVPWWRFGYPTEKIVKSLQTKFSDHFLIYSASRAQMEDIIYGDTVIDQGPKDPESGLSGDIISVDRIDWFGNREVEVEFRVWSGKLTSVTYRSIVHFVDSNWVVQGLKIKID